jgi:hypothetical protein
VYLKSTNGFTALDQAARAENIPKTRTRTGVAPLKFFYSAGREQTSSILSSPVGGDIHPALEAARSAVLDLAQQAFDCDHPQAPVEIKQPKAVAGHPGKVPTSVEIEPAPKAVAGRRR